MGNVESIVRPSGYPDIEDIELRAKRACLQQFRQNQAKIREKQAKLEEKQEVGRLFHKAKKYRYRRILFAVKAVARLPQHLQQDILAESGVMTCHCAHVSTQLEARGVPVAKYKHSNCTMNQNKCADRSHLHELLASIIVRSAGS